MWRAEWLANAPNATGLPPVHKPTTSNDQYTAQIPIERSVCRKLGRISTVVRLRSGGISFDLVEFLCEPVDVWLNGVVMNLLQRCLFESRLLHRTQHWNPVSRFAHRALP